MSAANMLRRHRRRPGTTAPRHPGFTLIELLVVISIIALLIGILLPVLGSARESARTVTCLSQMRQWALAANLYATDFKDFLPADDLPINDSPQEESNEGWWFNALPPYLDKPTLHQAWLDDGSPATGVDYRPNEEFVNNSIWYCPSAGPEVENIFNYGGNNQANGTAARPPTLGFGFGGDQPHTSLLAMTHPSKSLYLGEPEVDGVGAQGTIVMRANLTTPSAIPMDGVVDGKARHGGNAVNIAFAGGNAKTFDVDEADNPYAIIDVTTWPGFPTVWPAEFWQTADGEIVWGTFVNPGLNVPGAGSSVF
ncbi:MAG: DUF1559 domain-containing protein [Planctomycetota bacterium]